MAEHGGFGFDAAHAPAQYAEAVDHGRVGVGADERVGIGQPGAIGLFGHVDAIGQKFQIHLMADADAGGHDAQFFERLLAPLQKFVAFAVAAEFDFDVLVERIGHGPAINLHGVVHDQIHGDEGFDDARVAAVAHHGAAEAGEVHHTGHAGEVLQQDARGEIGDFFLRGGLARPPARQRFHLPPVVGGVALIAHGGFQENAHDIGQLGEGGTAQFGQRGQAMVGHGPAVVGERLQGGDGLGHLAFLRKHVSAKISCVSGGGNPICHGKKKPPCGGGVRDLVEGRRFELPTS